MAKKIILTIGCILLLSSAVRAEMLLRDYKKFIRLPNTKMEMEDFVGAMGWGVFYYNAIMNNQGRDKMFCLPDNFVPNKEAFIFLLNQEIKQPSVAGNWPGITPLPMILMSSLVHRYPCNN